MSDARLITWLLRLGIVALVAGGGAALWGFFSDRETFYTAWLAGFYFWLSMPLGALALLLIWDLTGGRWEPFARLPLGAMAATMPLFVVLFLPVIAGMHGLYSWSRPNSATGLHSHWYLNNQFFYIRVGVYFLIWNGFMAWRLLRPAGRPGLQWVSAIGVLLMGYSVTFAGIDWIMSTEPHWFSSIYGMVVGSSQFLVGLACALMLMTMTAPGGELREPFRVALALLTTILVAVLIFWAYTSFCQWLIIWEENIRAEITWYIERWRGPWGSIIYMLAVAQFGLPFVTLVWTPAKRSPPLVGSVCGLIVLTNLVQVWWLLLPSFHGTFSWLDPMVAIGIGGLWLALLSLLLRFGGSLGLGWTAGERQAIHV